MLTGNPHRYDSVDMTPERDAELQRLWEAANRELAKLLAAGLTNDQQPSMREQELLAELDHIEYEVGMAQRRRNC